MRPPSSHPSRVLVTGAAGRIGRAVVADLGAAGHRVTAVVFDDPGDLDVERVVVGDVASPDVVTDALRGGGCGYPPGCDPDRKSTRLNSSHVAISYAVFCLKKK